MNAKINIKLANCIIKKPQIKIVLTVKKLKFIKKEIMIIIIFVILLVQNAKKELKNAQILLAEMNVKDFNRQTKII